MGSRNKDTIDSRVHGPLPELAQDGKRKKRNPFCGYSHIQKNRI
jgi:hypothetical protein